ncbi:MAG: hypothetical protein KDI75_04735 [Xanthomonadales bacterium]|nr:hypothetical protein [Xanthomonadales bacterium]
MKRKLLTLTLMAAGLVAFQAPVLAADYNASNAAKAAAANVPDPAAQIQDLAYLFRQDNVTGIAQSLVPASKWEQVRAMYEIKRLEPISDDDRAEFDENIGRFVAPDAVEQLMAEIEPKLEQARPKLPGAMLMGMGAIQMAISSEDSDLTAEQRESLRLAFPGIQEWAASTDFLSSDTMRQALTLVTDAARHSGISSLDELKSLPLESALDRAGGVLAAAKDAVRLYGIDLDEIANTLQVEVLEIDGDTARVRTTVTMFNAPIASEHELVLLDGRWYGKEAAQNFSVANANEG